MPLLKSRRGVVITPAASTTLPVEEVRLMIERAPLASSTSTPVAVLPVRTTRMTLVCSLRVKLGRASASGRYVLTGPARTAFWTLNGG